MPSPKVALTPCELSLRNCARSLTESRLEMEALEAAVANVPLRHQRARLAKMLRVATVQVQDDENLLASSTVDLDWETRIVRPLVVLGHDWFASRQKSTMTQEDVDFLRLLAKAGKTLLEDYHANKPIKGAMGIMATLQRAADNFHAKTVLAPSNYYPLASERLVAVNNAWKFSTGHTRTRLVFSDKVSCLGELAKIFNQHQVHAKLAQAILEGTPKTITRLEDWASKAGSLPGALYAITAQVNEDYRAGEYLLNRALRDASVEHETLNKSTSAVPVVARRSPRL